MRHCYGVSISLPLPWPTLQAAHRCESRRDAIIRKVQASLGHDVTPHFRSVSNRNQSPGKCDCELCSCCRCRSRGCGIVQRSRFWGIPRILAPALRSNELVQQLDSHEKAHKLSTLGVSQRRQQGGVIDATTLSNDGNKGVSEACGRNAIDQAPGSANHARRSLLHSRNKLRNRSWAYQLERNPCQQRVIGCSPEAQVALYASICQP